MIHRLIGLVVVLAVIIIGLTMYLAPDDLAKCSGPGSGECATADAIVAVSGGDTDARLGARPILPYIGRDIGRAAGP